MSTEWNKHTSFPDIKKTTGGNQLSTSNVTKDLFNDITNALIYLYRHLKKK